jgi:hypothetical protein
MQYYRDSELSVASQNTEQGLDADSYCPKCGDNNMLLEATPVELLNSYLFIRRLLREAAQARDEATAVLRECRVEVQRLKAKKLELWEALEDLVYQTQRWEYPKISFDLDQARQALKGGEDEE